MNPKEKAAELVAKYMPHQWMKMQQGDAPSQYKAAAKQCALIAVEEMLKTGLLSKSPIKHHAIADVHEEYWNEVKTEIENL